jgi:hypothetical protein
MTAPTAIDTELFDVLIETVNPDGTWVAIAEQDIDMGNVGYDNEDESAQPVSIFVIVEGPRSPLAEQCRITRFEVFPVPDEDASLTYPEGLDFDAFQYQDWRELTTILRRDVATVVNQQ